MADNFAATPGSGATFGMDEVVDGTLGTVKVGFGKIMDGTLDSTNKLIVNSSGEALVKDTTARTSLASIDGKITAVNTGAVVVSSSALPSLAATSTKQSDGTQQTKLTNGSLVVDVKTLGTQVTSTDNGLIVNAAIHGLSTGGGGGYVDVKVNPSGALTADVSGSTLAANSGVDIGDVTINNAAGASAVNIQDGGNSITVDGTVGVSGSVAVTGPVTDTQLRASNVGVALNSLLFPVSTNNSSTAQLAASATFTGTIETVQNLQAAQIQIFSDQPFTLNIDQFIDAGGTKLTSTDTFTRLANVPFNENVTLPGNYFRIRVQNTGASTTTTLQIDTTFGIMATGPRTVTTLGNNRLAINEINGTAVDSNSGNKSAGTMRVVLATDQPALTNKLLVTPDSVALPANQSVNVSQINAVTPLMGNGVTGTGSQRVTIASDNTAISTAGFMSVKIDQTTPGTTNAVTATGNVAGAATDSGNPIKAGAVYNTTRPTYTTGQRTDLQSDTRGNLNISLMSLDTATTQSFQADNADGVANSATANKMAIIAKNQIYNGTSYDLQRNANADGQAATGLSGTGNMLYNGTTWDRMRSGGVTGMQGVVTQASPTGGYTPGKLVSAATTNATSVKASAGTLGHVSASNVNAAPRYLKFYNKASAPTVGTDVPVLTYIIPGNTAGAGTNIPLPPQGINFSTGIAFAITTGAADSDTGAVAANEIIINYGTI